MPLLRRAIRKLGVTVCRHLDSENISKSTSFSEKDTGSHNSGGQPDPNTQQLSHFIGTDFLQSRVAD